MSPLVMSEKHVLHWIMSGVMTNNCKLRKSRQGCNSVFGTAYLNNTFNKLQRIDY